MLFRQVLLARKNFHGKMKPNQSELICDFVGGAVGHRFRAGNNRSLPLARAVGLKKGLNPTIVDATAGLGRDAFLLASLGAHVTLIERNEHMHALLQEGIAKARDEGGEYAEIVSRMKLIYGDAKEILPTLTPEVILIDPMHPPRQKSALVKKEMRLIREIVGTDPDAKQLLKTALANAKQRVVLKWPLRGDPIEGVVKPSHQITGKTTRYDVFIRT